MNYPRDLYGVLPAVPGLSFADVFSGHDAATIAYLPFWPLVTGLMYAVYSLIGFGNRFAYYFLLKQPLIIGDVGLAYLLFRYISSANPRRSIWALWLWLLSPLTIIVSAVWGTFDSIAMAFVMLSIMSTVYVKRGFWTGLGIFAKSVPIMYAVPTTWRHLRDSRGLLIALGLPIVFSIGMFLILGWPISAINPVLLSAASKGGETMSIWDSFFYLNYLGILPPLTPDVYHILGLLWIPAVIVFTLIAFRVFRFKTDYGMIQSLIVVTLAFLIFRARVRENYAIYLLALSVIDVAVWNPQRKKLLLLTMAVASIFLINNNYFLIPFLSPIYPNFVQMQSTLNQVIGPVRYAVNFLTGSMFTYFNIRYLIAALRRQR